MTSKKAADENAFINSDNRKRRSLLQEVPPLGSVQTTQFEIQFDGLELGDRYLQIYYASEKKNPFIFCLMTVLTIPPVGVATECVAFVACMPRLVCA